MSTISIGRKGKYKGTNGPTYIDLNFCKLNIKYFYSKGIKISKITRIINKLYNLNISRVPIQRIINEYK